ncbi:MAG: tRNA epoxyqueuosine(34) reductase QueG [Methylococcales bacterium]
MPKTITPDQAQDLASKIKQWGIDLGFQQIGIADIDLTKAEKDLQRWLKQGYHGEMEYMSRHGEKRYRPEQLVPGTLRVISARMDYFPENKSAAVEVLENPEQAYLSRYALGRDYHKLLRKRLQQLALMIEEVVGSYGYRVFTDSAPVLEKALAEKAGLGWIGKHTNLINQHSGSWFFLGEIYTELPLPTDPAVTNHCGDCIACIDICPTKAIVAPYKLDARRCISYLTIELHGAIPEQFRKPIGNRIYGCDDCQLVCPWNRFAQHTAEPDFIARHGLDTPQLIELFLWDEATFLKKTEGSAIRRIGHQRWLRNIAVALGNAADSKNVINTLTYRLEYDSTLVREHVIWALEQH